MGELLVICAVAAACYLCYSAWVTGGIPESLSATYYTLGKSGWLFQVFTAGMGLMLLPMWIDGGEHDALAFMACAGLLFTGAAPMFRLPLEGAVHYGAAVVCGVSAVLWVILEGMYPYAVWWGFLALMAYVNWGRAMWWAEVAVMGMVFCALI